MSDLESRLQQVRARQQEAFRKRAAAEAKLDAVRSQKQDSLDRLSDMGFSSPQAAKERAQELKTQSESVLAGIEEKVRPL